MKSIYLVLAIIGFIVPNIFVVKVTLETNNLWMLTEPMTTFRAMFASDYSTAFIMDVIFVAVVFMVWSYVEARRVGIRQVWIFWLVMLALGLGGTVPLFLYWRERKLGVARLAGPQTDIG